MSPSGQPQASLSGYTRELLRVNGFLPEALDANRAGQLIPAQQAVVVRQQRRDRFFYLIIGGGVSAVCVYQLTQQAFQLQDVGWVVGLLVGAFLVAMGLGLDFLGIRRDLNARQVMMWEGPITRRSVTTDGGDSRGSTTYYYVVNGQSFSVRGQEAYDYLDEALRYRLYFLPKSKILVNIEPVA